MSNIEQRQAIREILFSWHKWRDYYYSDLKEQVITDDEWKVTRDKIDADAIDQIQALITAQKQELLSEIEKELPPDAAITKEDLGVDLARKSAANAVLGQVKSIITTKREEIWTRRSS